MLIHHRLQHQLIMATLHHHNDNPYYSPIIYKNRSFPAYKMAQVSFIPDSITRGVHLYNVTARVQDDRLRFVGSFDAAELLPVLIFSVGIPWVKPCVDNVCCLWEVAMRYRDDDLIAAIGKKCDQWMNFTGKELMKGSEERLDGNIKQWDLTTRIHPNFVIMLFLCLSPIFYMYYEIVPIQWVERKSVMWSAAWYGERCHTVIYPDGREVCIHCSNAKPLHSTYIFSADWFQSFECKWQCDLGYAGSDCEVKIDTAVYASGGVFLALCIAGILYGIRKRQLTIPRASSKTVSAMPVQEDQIPHDKENDNNPVPLVPSRVRSEMIAFKENAVGEIRIKFL